MDELIIKEMIKKNIALIVMFLFSAAIMIFTVIGVYDAFWNVPAKCEKIAELTDERDLWQARAKELEKYVETREGQYRVATKFDNLFMLIAEPNQVMDFEALDGYIKSRKAFFVKAKK